MAAIQAREDGIWPKVVGVGWDRGDLNQDVF